MRLSILPLLYCLLSVSLLHAQVPSRAGRYYNLSMRHEAKKEHEQARRMMERAIGQYPAFAEAYSTLGAWYFNDHQFGRSADIFRRAAANVPNGQKLYAFPLARSLVFSGQAAEALEVINNAAVKETPEWKQLRGQAQFVGQAISNAWKDTVFPMGRVNTRYAEMFPWISADGQKIYFTRRVRNVDEDFFFSERDSCGGWFTGTGMGSPPNTPQQEAAQMISGDGHYLFFMRCENRSENGWEQGGCDLYMAYTADSVWSVPQSFGATINSPAYEGMPCLSADNRELYFVSNREGGFGGFDIWVSEFRDGFWQAPRNLGPRVNTAGNETAPFLHIDNQSLYFASTGHTGMGGSDLFLTRRISDTVWGRAVNMGYPINTTADESSLSITVDGQQLYFASDRDSTAGNFDLYETRLPAQLQPVPVSVVKGYVYDSLSGARLNYASIYVSDARSGQQLYHFHTNRGDGSFMITLPVNRSYSWHIDRVAYKDREDTLLIGEDYLTQSLTYNMSLLPQDYVAPVNDSLVLTINFPLNGAKLSDSDRTAIYNAMLPWMDHKQALIVYVNGYTDNTGTPLINEQLSYMRAGLVSESLITLGMDEMNIRKQGWGEANPIASNDTDEGKDQNRRVEIIIRR